MTTHWLDNVTFNQDGLLPAIAQDKDTGEILMVAWMNREALALTAQTKTGVYFSRSRGKLWHKGESSGHTQRVHDIYMDCDNDVIVLKITQIGGIACHTGRRSCFYQRLDLSQDTPTWQTVTPVIKDPSKIYNKDSVHVTDNVNDTNSSVAVEVETATILQQLDTLLAARKHADPDSSYVASLYAKGLNKILEKVGEEAVEAILAAKDMPSPKAMTATDQNKANRNKADDDDNADTQALTDDLIYEIADVWFHTLVTLAWFNIPSSRILAELARRFGLSGIAEKNARQACKSS